MTPQLQQAIKLLQLNRLEMQELINQELVENPVLEELSEDEAYSDDQVESMEAKEAEADAPSETAPEVQGEEKILDGKQDNIDWEDYMESFSSAPSLPSTREVPSELPNYENMVANTTDLVTHLEWQVSMSELAEDERVLAKMIIGNLDEEGYFTGSLDDISAELKFDREDAEEVLKVLQRMDPFGVAARDLRECLLVQAEMMFETDALPTRIIEKHLPDLEKRNYQAIIKSLGCTMEEIADAAHRIQELNPKPGRAYAVNDAQYITPDVYVYKVGEDYAIQLNEDGLPKLRVSHYYKKILDQARAEGRGKGGVTKAYITEKLRSAVWLIKSIQNRQKTIYKVMESIVRHQRDFFEKGVQCLKPMVLRDVAADVGVHESTISRVTTNKYVHTPVGTFELKYFFNSGIATQDGGGDVASEAVREKIKAMIGREDTKRPLSDQKIVELLKDDGIDIARRTVAKYREGLGILSSARRKKIF